MNFLETPLAGAYVVELSPIRDTRGFFARTFCKQEFEAINHTKEFVQINHSFSVQKGTLRGMHFQVPPSAEIKLVRCISGEVYDVIVDLRKDSPTFLMHFVERLSAQNQKMMYVPEGFAHGFQTLEENAQLLYHHTAYYAPEDERGIRFDDPALDISWPLPVHELSDRDRQFEYIDNKFTGIELNKLNSYR